MTLSCFPEKPQNQPEGPPKQENEGECFAPYTPETPKKFIQHSKGFSEDLQNTLRTNLQTCERTSQIISFGNRKSFQIHIRIMLKQFPNAPLHLSLQQKLRLQKSYHFGRNYYVFGKSPKISPKGHQNKRTKESASHHILPRHQRYCLRTPKKLCKTSRTPSGRTCRHAKEQVKSLALGIENHSKFIFALC